VEILEKDKTVRFEPGCFVFECTSLRVGIILEGGIHKRLSQYNLEPLLKYILLSIRVGINGSSRK